MFHFIQYYFPQTSPLLLAMLTACFFGRRIRYNNQIYIQEYDEPWKSPVFPWLLVFGWVAFMAGMRSSMNDTSTYIYSFKTTSGTWAEITGIINGSGKDKGWSVLMNLFKMCISTNYHVFFMSVAAFEAVLFIHTLRRESVDFLDSCWYFCCATLYYNNFSMMRQWLAVSIVFTAGSLIRDRKFIKYAFVCAFAAQFHNSAYLFIPVYFIVQGEAWGKKQNMILAAFAMGLILLTPLLNILDNATKGTTYNYVVSTMQGSTGSSIIRAFIAVMPVLLAYIDRDAITNSMMNVCVNLSLLNFMLNLLASFTSGLYVVRLATYTSVFNMLLYPYLLECAVSEKNRRFFKFSYFAIYLIFYIYQMNHQGCWGYKSDVLTWLSNY